MKKRTKDPQKFDLNAESAELVRRVNAKKKKLPWNQRSQLDKYQSEILKLHKIKGHKYEHIRLWLKGNGVDVCLSTVTRWFKKNG